MTRQEFAECMAALAATVQKDLPKEAAEVYYALLRDVPLATLKLAVLRVAAQRCYPSFPLPAEIMDACHAEQPMLFGAAWHQAMEATRRLRIGFDPNYRIVLPGGRVLTPGEYNLEVLESLPPQVARAMIHFGLGALKDNETCRAQFRKVFEELRDRERQQEWLPPPLREQAKIAEWHCCDKWPLCDCQARIARPAQGLAELWRTE